MDEDLSCLILSSTSLGLSALSILFIFYHAFVDFNFIMHFTCFIGACIITALGTLDFFRAIYLIKFSTSLVGIYFISTSITIILSCYIILQVGTNFYQDYNIVRTTLMYAPIVVTFGVFGCSVFTTVQFLLSESQNPDPTFINITLALSLLSGFLTLLYAIAPLYNIRYQTKLQPEQTAISIVHFSIVLILFISHFVIYGKVVLDSQFLEMRISAIHNIILLLIFPGCLIKPPRTLVKKIKRNVLGVEELTIGGDYRPDMLPNNYADTAPGPKISHLTPELRNNRDVNNNNNLTVKNSNNIRNVDPINASSKNKNGNDNFTYSPQELSSNTINVQLNKVNVIGSDSYLNGSNSFPNVNNEFKGINNSFIDNIFKGSGVNELPEIAKRARN